MSPAKWNLKEAYGKVPARGTRTLSGRSCADELATQSEVPRLHGRSTVNGAGIWNEGLSSYHGRSHRRAETKYEARLEKIYCEKSAEAIIQQTDNCWKS